MRIEPTYAGAGDEHRVEALADPFSALDAQDGSRRRRWLDWLAGFAVMAASAAVVANALVMQPPGRPGAAALARAGGTPVVLSPDGEKAKSSSGGLGYLGTRGTLTSTSPAIVRPASPVVADIQRELAKRGFYDGPMDGLVGPRTEQAVKAYEQSANLRVTGNPDDALLLQLRKTAAAAPGDITGAVRPPADVPGARMLAVQKALAKLGYGPIKLDGKPGASTRAAILKFERDRGLPADGEVSERLMRELSAVTGTAVN